ncbi:MAG: ABC transporter substrate-binding protein [Thermodesulfobacteriota bacterium]|jgi:branched-chain amino acid transport system substrate-binding protein
MKAKKLFIVTVVTGTIMAIFFMGSFAKPAAAQAKTLKVGLLTNLGWPLGLDMKRFLAVVIPLYNKKGGLAIGGDRYQIDLIVYDSKNDPETGRAAVERLVFQDKVKFLMGDITADAWIPLTEENKILSIVSTPSPAALRPNLKYTFQGSYLNTSVPVEWTWFIAKYPEVKTVGGMFPDLLHGHGDAKQIEKLCQVLNLNFVTQIFYPPDTTDFSAYATKMKTSNPQVYCTAGGGTVQDSLSVKFLREAGYKGILFMYRGVDPGNWGKVVPLNILEGAIGPVIDFDLEPHLLPGTKEAKDAFIAKYGKWDNPAVLFSKVWYLMKTALEKAQSIDPDKVAAVIGNGIKFDSPFGHAMMISRPDQSNPKTIDGLYAPIMGTLKEGKIKVLDSLSIEEAFGYIKKSRIFGEYK